MEGPPHGRVNETEVTSREFVEEGLCDDRQLEEEERDRRDGDADDRGENEQGSIATPKTDEG